MPKYCIADTFFEINAPEWAFYDNFSTFLCSSDNTDVWCNIVFQKRSSELRENLQPTVKTSSTIIYEEGGQINNLSGDEKDIPYYTVSAEDGSLCTMYIDPEYDDPDDGEKVRQVREGIFVAFREIVIAALAQRNGLLIHSSTIIWNGQGIIFSAPSGTGKTTHTNLWKQKHGVQILDGDVTACRIVNGNCFAYGLPWCGTSKEFMNKCVPLRAIVFLQQATYNEIEKLDYIDSVLRLTSRSFLLPFNDIMMNRFLNVTQEIAASAECYLLSCLPDLGAVELVKKCLEKN